MTYKIPQFYLELMVMNLAVSYSMKDHKLGLFVNKVIRRISVFKKEAVRYYYGN